MSREIEVGPVSELTPGVVAGAGHYAVGNADGELFDALRHTGLSVIDASRHQRRHLSAAVT